MGADSEQSNKTHSLADMRDEIIHLAQAASERDTKMLFSEAMDAHPRFVIYGAGNVGRSFLNYKKMYEGYELTGFLDKNADIIQEYYGYTVYDPDDTRLDADFRKETLVVLALLLPYEEYTAIEDYLHALGYKHIVNSVYDLKVHIGDESIGSLGGQFFSDATQRIIQAFDLLYDDHSRDVFLSIFQAYALSEYHIPAQSHGMIQYVDVKVPFRNRYRVFVDCGAFTGDTLESLAAHYEVEYYFGFEPEANNFAKLSQTYDRVGKQIGQAVLLPVGVGGLNEFLRFRGAASSGRIDTTGDRIIQVVRLDDVLKGYDNLMIKMDIEGAETAALYGAKTIITETKPDLAICVYHKVGDMWDIPLLLREWVPKYRFYLRNHYPMTMETVLYATVGE